MSFHSYTGSGYLMLILILYSYCFNNPCYSETDTLKQGIEFKEWDYLISSNRVFILKFFGFGSTISSYLGVFYYNKFPNLFAYHVPRDAVWVANRNDPIQDTYSNFMIDVHGKLSIFSRGGTVLDLFTPTLLVKRNTSVTLLDSGNLVLHELFLDGSVKQVLWQSFDYPTDTLLPGMKLGINFRSGHRWSLSSWASDRLPAPGSFSLTVDPNVTGQLMILRHGNIHWTSGIWQNGQFEKSDPRWYSSPGLDVRLYFNETEQSFMYLTKTYDSFPALTIHEDGRLTGEPLNLYVQCGLTTRYSSPGCSYEFENLKCREGSYLIDVFGYIYGDEYEYDETYNWTLDDCKRTCWANCSCIAYSYATKNRKGCKTYGKMIYNPAKAGYEGIQYFAFAKFGENKIKWWVWLLLGIGSFAPLASCYIIDKKLHIRGKAKRIQKLLLYQTRRFSYYVRSDRTRNAEVHYFTFQCISSATDNFSSTNKLGEGGFGAVYKGILIDGQEIAVKRLSRSSGQGVREFKNEIELIAKLQHTNLVRLLGCCVEKKEKILVYEYMPNSSLDLFLFDPRKKGQLKWKNRFVIIDGIAQGLVYLHKFSRLRVIHRDLKASNILLDGDLNPKISDFGMAKLFGINESEANTSRVVGTR
ncbi:G-type lectin S-receptor-like serine/threonine-protein kinase CES101 [Tanacetum coccineum]